MGGIEETEVWFGGERNGERPVGDLRYSPTQNTLYSGTEIGVRREEGVFLTTGFYYQFHSQFHMRSDAYSTLK